MMTKSLYRAAGLIQPLKRLLQGRPTSGNRDGDGPNERRPIGSGQDGGAVRVDGVLSVDMSDESGVKPGGCGDWSPGRCAGSGVQIRPKGEYGACGSNRTAYGDGAGAGGSPEDLAARNNFPVLGSDLGERRLELSFLLAGELDLEGAADWW